MPATLPKTPGSKRGAAEICVLHGQRRKRANFESVSTSASVSRNVYDLCAVPLGVLPVLTITSPGTSDLAIGLDARVSEGLQLALLTRSFYRTFSFPVFRRRRIGFVHRGYS